MKGSMSKEKDKDKDKEKVAACQMDDDGESAAVHVLTHRSCDDM